MGKPQIITSPSGEELVVLPRSDYEELVDALAAQEIDAALTRGEEELLSAEEQLICAVGRFEPADVVIGPDAHHLRNDTSSDGGLSSRHQM